MNHEPKSPMDADDRFIETLLHEAYDPDADADQHRIDELMRRIRGNDESVSASPVTPAEASQSIRRPSWIRMAIAASVLVICGYALLSIGGSNTAYAAVVRALHAVPPTREYRVRMLNRWPVVGEREVTATLFVNNRDEFCLQHPGWLPGGELWVGGDLESRWIVPRIGPIITGDEDLVSSALSQQGLESKMLHLQTLLKRMSEDYDLSLMDDVRLKNPQRESESILCQHVVGVRRTVDERSPVKIELWANKESGVAERVVLDWPNDDESWLPIRWQIDLVGNPPLADDWFKYQGHSEQGRTILPFGSSDDSAL